MSLSQENWKLFNFDKIFTIKKGFYNKKPEPSGIGTIPFIGATDSNNGVTEYYTLEKIEATSKTGAEPNNAPLSKKLFEGKALCVTNNGSVGYAYYQESQFTCSHDVNPLYRIDAEFNQYTALFVASIIMYDRYRWGYGRKWRPERMSKSKIKLPAKCDEDGFIFDGSCKYSDEGFVPDWSWMEYYIKTLNHKPLKTEITQSNTVDFRPHNWEFFYLHDILNCSMGNGIDSILTTSDNPKYNYVSRNSNGNGVVGFVDEIEDKTPFPPGSMSLALGGSFLGSCFIQNKPYYTAQNVAVLQEKVPLSCCTKLFLAALIRNECKIKYQAFGRELNSHFRKDFTIKLPVKYNNNKIVVDETKEFSAEGFIPDWLWMENYIKTLPYSDRV